MTNFIDSDEELKNLVGDSTDDCLDKSDFSLFKNNNMDNINSENKTNALKNEQKKFANVSNKAFSLNTDPQIIDKPVNISNPIHIKKSNCKSDIPNNKKKTSIEGIVNQSNLSNFIPVQKNQIPSHQNFIPVQGNLNPLHQNFIPAQGNLNPSHQNFIPVQGNLNPSHQNFIPVQGNLNPSHQNFIPVQGNLNPSHQNFISVQGNLNPSQQNFIPVQHNFNPRMSAPSNDNSLCKKNVPTDVVPKSYKPPVSKAQKTLIKHGIRPINELPPDHFSLCYAIIEFNSMRFLITDRPTKANLGAYIDDLIKYNVKYLVRVCDSDYSTSEIQEAGIDVFNLPFNDGHPPPNNVIQIFIQVVRDQMIKNPNSAIAIHCVAGLGRAPVLVSVALIEGGMTYLDAVEYIRSKRRGAINSKQLDFLERYKSGKNLVFKKDNRKCKVM